MATEKIESYNEALSFIHGTARFGSRLGLDRMRALAEFILPEGYKKTEFLHIAGTNGKGSVTAMMASVLQKQGYRAGQYISPYLEDFRERIQINGDFIPKEDLVKFADLVKRQIPLLNEHPTEFEIVTAIGLGYFIEQECDYIAWEVGLGGRYDATNIVTPKICVITTIDIDHTAQLGDTLAKIAFEKAGIIKPGTPVVTGVTEEEPLSTIKEIAKNQNSPVITVGENGNVTWRQVESKGKRQIIDIRGPGYSFKDLIIPFAGKHQQQNAAVAVAALMASGIPIGESALRQGLEETFWPGRLEYLQEKPKIILDGAHNIAGAKVVSDFLKTLERDRLIMVFGVLEDKDHKDIVKALASHCDKVYTTTPNTPRALDPKILAQEVKEYCPDTHAIPGIEDALSTALSDLEEGDALLVCGSLYLVGPSRTFLRGRLGIT